MKHLLTSLAVLLLLWGVLNAQNPSPTDSSTAPPVADESPEPAETAAAAPTKDGETGAMGEEEAAIRKAIDSYVEAFNKADAKALAGHWGEGGELITPSGEVLQGREALEQNFRDYFAETKQAKLELSGTIVEFLSPSVAVESGVARVLVPGEEPSESEYEAVHVKSAGDWKIDSVREQEPPAPPPSHYEQLKDLEWMIGTWVDDAEDASIETSCRWTTNNNFLVRSFRVYVQDRVDFEGTQVIGWDPHAQTIRSWLFDSDGGFGAGRWSGTGNRWTVQSLSVLPDGRRASATNVYDLLDENTVQFRSIGRQVDGELLPNVGPITVRRTENP